MTDFKETDYISFQARDVQSIVEQAFNKMLEQTEAGPRSQLHVSIMHPGIDGGFYINGTHLSGRRILARLAILMQSNKNVHIDQGLLITILKVLFLLILHAALLYFGSKQIFFKMNLNLFGNRMLQVERPGGKGRPGKRKATVGWKEWRKQKQCFIQINNDDDLCLYRALVVAKARLDKHSQWETIRKGDKQRHTLQKKLALQLKKDCGLEAQQGASGIPELKKAQVIPTTNSTVPIQNTVPGLITVQFQAFLTDYQIKVFSKDAFDALIYKGPDSENVLALYLNGEHYDVITSLPAFYGGEGYCHHCDKATNQRGTL